MPRYLLAVLSLVLALVAGNVAVQEYEAFRTNIRPMSEKLHSAAGPEGDLGPAASVRSQVTKMAFCVRVQQSPLFGLYPATARQSASHLCRAQANIVLQRSPTMAMAVLARAVSHMQLGELDASLHDLRLSWSAAPAQGWIADHRVRLALSLADKGETAAMQVVTADILLMVQNRRLREALARIYGQAADHREKIVSAIEGASPADQRAFLSAVRRTR